MEGEANRRKWLPLQSDPAVFSKYAKALGCDGMDFGDVFGLDPELLLMVPQPVIAVILLFPIRKEEEETTVEVEEKKDDAKTPFYIKQKIGNACGTIALLHAVCNNLDQVKINEHSFFDIFIKETQHMTADQKADQLEKLVGEFGLEEAHNAAAVESPSVITEDEINTNLHFICYIHAGGKIWELDGRKSCGALPLLDCAKEELLLKSSQIIKQRMENSESIQFNIMAGYAI